MKTYNQFVVESYSARENIQEALPLLIPAAIGAAKVAGYGLAAYQAYQAAQKLKKGDYKGAALDAALAIPSVGVAGKIGQAFKWGNRAKSALTNTLRVAKGGYIANSALKDIEAEEKAAASQPAASKASLPQPAASKASLPQPAASKASLPQPAAKTRVLSKLKGVQGTGVGKNFVAKNWSSAESDRYKRVAAAKLRNK
jgi:hypothetical protein